MRLSVSAMALAGGYTLAIIVVAGSIPPFKPRDVPEVGNLTSRVTRGEGQDCPSDYISCSSGGCCPVGGDCCLDGLSPDILS